MTTRTIAGRVTASWAALIDGRLMALLVDTSVWSLAYRRDTPPGSPEVPALRNALVSGGGVVSTGVILLELLRGLVPQGARSAILAAFDASAYLEPTRADYVAAADLSTTCRAAGVQLGSVDALIAQLAIVGNHILLTTDQDFHCAAPHIDLQLWRSS